MNVAHVVVVIVVENRRCIPNNTHDTTLYFIHKAGWPAFTGTRWYDESEGVRKSEGQMFHDDVRETTRVNKICLEINL